MADSTTPLQTPGHYLGFTRQPDGTMAVNVASQAGAVTAKPVTDRSLTVGTTSQQLMPANATRLKVIISNDTSGTVYIRYGTAAATAAVGGGNIVINPSAKYFDDNVSSAIQIIGSAAGLNVTAYEY